MIAEHLGAPDFTRVLKVGKKQVNTTEMLWCQSLVRAVEDALNDWPCAIVEMIEEVENLTFSVTDEQPDRQLVGDTRTTPCS